MALGIGWAPLGFAVLRGSRAAPSDRGWGWVIGRLIPRYVYPWNETRTAGAPQAFLCLPWLSSGQPDFSGDSGCGVCGVQLARPSESRLWAALQLHSSGT